MGLEECFKLINSLLKSPILKSSIINKDFEHFMLNNNFNFNVGLLTFSLYDYKNYFKYMPRFINPDKKLFKNLLFWCPIIRKKIKTPYLIIFDFSRSKIATYWVKEDYHQLIFGANYLNIYNYKKASFEEVLNNISDSSKEYILFNLDLFGEIK